MLAGLEKARGMLEGRGSDKDIGRIATLYASRQAERMEPIYQSLRERYPNLKNYFLSGTTINPLEVSKRAKSEYKNFIKLINRAKRALVKSRNYDGVGVLDNIFISYERFVELSDAFNDSIEDYYVRFARRIKDVSSEKKINPKDVVRDQSIVDGIERSIFSTREDAKAFRETARKVSAENSRLLNEFYDNLERWGIESRPKWLPAKEESDALIAETARWREQEYDRIYGTKG